MEKILIVGHIRASIRVNAFFIPSSLSTSFCNFCTDRSANSARASAYDTIYFLSLCTKNLYSILVHFKYLLESGGKHLDLSLIFLLSLISLQNGPICTHLYPSTILAKSYENFKSYLLFRYFQ